ncbi:hypothetical protein NE848_13515 [Gramella jeungdoensis]|uniref:Uncharacterized protein n=1 Tax=Gramella jeungdoensis TaxID=708091 RepID=A0ABT0Z3U5_9FLAO|nr:hypothetical protein [Gramella jeungdoensis]MCM8570406.1 hypothetical protein [Gramella jeungdoensis]
MLNRILFLMLFSSFLGVNAQQANPFMSDGGMVIFTKEKEPDHYTGSPYYEDDFKLGVIHDDKGRSMQVLMRYNAVEDVVVIRPKPDSEEEYVLPKLKSITYELGNYTYFIDNLNTNNGNIEAYFAKFYEGANSTFIGLPKVEVTPPQKARTGYEKDKPADIDVEMVYYLSLNGGQLQEVRLKEKDLKDLFKSDKMEEYFDKHKIKTEEDVVNMLKYFEDSI